MSDPRWPASCPQAPRYGGYSEAPRANVVSFTPEVGPPITRRRGTLRTRRVQVGFQMKGAQVETFERFFEDELADGALPFRWIAPRTQEDKRWQFEIQEQGEAYRIAPASDRAHDLWDVSFTLILIGP